MTPPEEFACIFSHVSEFSALDTFVHMTNPAVDLIKSHAVGKPRHILVTLKQRIQHRAFGRRQPLRHAGAKPRVRMQMKYLFRLAQPLKMIALHRVEQSWNLEPGYRPQRPAQMKIWIETMLLNEFGQQRGTRHLPLGDRVMKRQRFREAGFDCRMPFRKSQQAGRRQTEGVRAGKKNIVRGQIRPKQQHIRIDPPAAALIQNRIAKQIAVDGESLVERSHDLVARQNFRRIAALKPPGQMKTGVVVGKHFNLMAVIGKTSQAKKLIRTDRIAMPECLHHLRRRAGRQRYTRFDGGRGRFGRSGFSRRIAWREPVHGVCRQAVGADPIFDFLQQSVLAKPVRNRAVRQPRLRRNFYVEAAKKAVKIAAFGRSVILGDSNPPPDFIPQMSEIAVRQAFLQALA
jgi:hypothetical protein